MNCIYNTQSLQQRLQEPGQKNQSKKTYWSGFLKSKNVEKITLNFLSPTYSHSYLFHVNFSYWLFNEYREGL